MRLKTVKILNYTQNFEIFMKQEKENLVRRNGWMEVVTCFLFSRHTVKKVAL